MAPPVPSTLTDDDILRMQMVRREVWKGGMKGLVVGTAAGVVMAVGGKRLVLRGGDRFAKAAEGSWRKMAHSSFVGFKHLNVLLPLGLGAFCSFFFSIGAGRAALPFMGDLWKKGEKPPSERPGLTPYMVKQLEGQDDVYREKKQEELSSFERRKLALQKRQERIARGEIGPESTREEVW